MIDTQIRHCIVKDASRLQPLAEPRSGKPSCRRIDLDLMMDYISGVFSHGRGRNLFIYGKPGTGKTICVKGLLFEINKRAEKSHIALGTVYVNCGRTSTFYFTMIAIVNALHLSVPDCGWQLFRLKMALEKVLEEKTIVICLDEIDGLRLKQRELLLHYLNRLHQVTLILVSSTCGNVSSLSSQVLSTLQPKLLPMRPYTFEETLTILQERVAEAFHPGTIKEDLVREIAQVTSEKGDIRLGFAILLTAGYLAEGNERSDVGIEDVRSAIRSETIMDMIQKIDALERLAAQLEGG